MDKGLTTVRAELRTFSRVSEFLISAQTRAVGGISAKNPVKKAARKGGLVHRFGELSPAAWRLDAPGSPDALLFIRKFSLQLRRVVNSPALRTLKPDPHRSGLLSHARKSFSTDRRHAALEVRALVIRAIHEISLALEKRYADP